MQVFVVVRGERHEGYFIKHVTELETEIDAIIKQETKEGLWWTQPVTTKLTNGGTSIKRYQNHNLIDFVEVIVFEINGSV